MNMKVAASVAVMACAMESAMATFLLTTAAATGTTSVLSLGVGTTTLTAGTAGALALTGGVVLLKGLALGALAIAASRHRRAAVSVDETDAAFSVLAAQEPAQCYRRLICDLATGSLEKSENDVIVSLFNKDTSISSAKFEFATAAKLGKQIKSVQQCELRYSCPLTGEQIQKLF